MAKKTKNAPISTVGEVKAAKFKNDGNDRTAYPIAGVPNFYLRVTKTGAKSFWLKYPFNGKQKTKTWEWNGNKGDLAAARQGALQLLDKLTDPDFDPAVDEAAKAGPRKSKGKVPFWEDAVEEYLEARKLDLPGDSIISIRSHFRCHMTPYWKGRKLTSVTRKDIEKRLKEISLTPRPNRGPMMGVREDGQVPTMLTTAESVKKTLRTFLNWCVDRGEYIRPIDNPMLLPWRGDDMKFVDSTHHRTTALTGPQVRVYWEAVQLLEDSSPTNAAWANVLRLLLLTGQRRNEVWQLPLDAEMDTRVLPILNERTLKVEDVEAQVWTVGRRRGGTKNVQRIKALKKPVHELPLAPMALRILNEQRALAATKNWTRTITRRGGAVYGPFPALFPCKRAEMMPQFRAAIETVSKKLGIAMPTEEGWVLHDLRHTLSTRLADEPLNVPSEYREMILNHRGKSTATKGDSGTYMNAMLIGQKLKALEKYEAWIAQQTGQNIVPLRFTA